MAALRRLKNLFGRTVSAPDGEAAATPPGPQRGPAIGRPEKLVVLGMITRHPIGGMVWLAMQHVIGLARLGYDVYYIEAHGAIPKSFMRDGKDGADAAAEFLDKTFTRFGLAGRWGYQAFHSDGRCFGLSESTINGLFREASLIFNLHGGTTPRPEHTQTGRLVYLGTDPVDREVALDRSDPEIVRLFEAHSAFFTWGENYGRPDCKVPRSLRFDLVPTRQPVVLDYWRPNGIQPRDVFTTVGSWRQLWREITIDGERYGWSKHHEFLKFLDLPARTTQPFELALGWCGDDDRAMLQSHGWRVIDGLSVSADVDDYRKYVIDSRGEFTVAKDQNVRLRSGWFSDRSATYLAAGRPVITQDTGFGNVLPVGEGLFPFSTVDDIVAAIDAINSDYGRHSRAAAEIAREYFSHDRVLPKVLAHAGVSQRVAV
jgi:hypothetical protein